MNIGAMQEEVMAWAESKGWEPDPDRAFADECALLHSEISEALEVYRTRKLERYTDSNGKPDDVASELADIFIRLLHYSACGRFELKWPAYTRFTSDPYKTFSSWVMSMHRQVTKAYEMNSYDSNRVGRHLNSLLAVIDTFCLHHGILLMTEYRRKMDYNQTRSYRHGGRNM